jgi:hypothetical protein
VKSQFYIPGDPGNPGMAASLVGVLGTLYFLSKASDLHYQASDLYTAASLKTLQGDLPGAQTSSDQAKTLSAQGDSAHTLATVSEVLLFGGLAYYAYKSPAFRKLF